MNKWFGEVGYIETTEEEPGVWVPNETVKKYYGEFVKKSTRFQVSSGINDDKDVTAELSIVADSYANFHFHAIRYVIIGGVKWKVNTIEPQRPRLILSIGGEYNG